MRSYNINTIYAMFTYLFINEKTKVLCSVKEKQTQTNKPIKQPIHQLAKQTNKQKSESNQTTTTTTTTTKTTALGGKMSLLQVPLQISF